MTWTFFINKKIIRFNGYINTQNSEPSIVALLCMETLSITFFSIVFNIFHVRVFQLCKYMSTISIENIWK